MNLPIITPAAQLAEIAKRAKALGITAKEYATQYDLKTGNRKQFSDYEDTGIDIVIKAVKKHKTPLTVIVAAIVLVVVIIYLLKKSK
jgi:hypothetical protein